LLDREGLQNRLLERSACLVLGHDAHRTVAVRLTSRRHGEGDVKFAVGAAGYVRLGPGLPTVVGEPGRQLLADRCAGQVADRDRALLVTASDLAEQVGTEV